LYRIDSMEIKIVEGNYIITLEINDEYSHAIDYIQNHQELSDYAYTYEFEEEKKACSCSDIFEVHDTILRNLFYPK